MFWKNNNLEISVFESWVVMLRTGKIALNTFKNIHLQSNIFYSSKEGTGWWQGGLWREQPHWEWLVGLGPRQWHALMASFWAADLTSWPQCLWPSFNKGKGRLVLPSNSQEQPLLSSPWSWPSCWSRGKGCRRARQYPLWKEPIFGPPAESPFPSLKLQCFWLLAGKDLSRISH